MSVPRSDSDLWSEVLAEQAALTAAVDAAVAAGLGRDEALAAHVLSLPYDPCWRDKVRLRVQGGPTPDHVPAGWAR